MPAHEYRQLQKPEDYTFQNRYVGNYLIYGTGSGWGYPNNVVQSALFIVNWTGGNSHQLLLPHGVNDTNKSARTRSLWVVMEKDLHFSSVRLNQSPEMVSRYTRHEAAQGELRGQRFLF